MLVYVAILKDNDLSVDEVLGVYTTMDKIDYLVKDYYGLTEKYPKNDKIKFLGYVKIEYSEFEDDLDGYYKIECDGVIEKVFIFNKVLDEPI
jgi:hypothetical protein